MKVRITEEGKINKKDSDKKELSRRGKNSKAKGGKYERDVAKAFKERYNIEFIRTPQSGGFAKKSLSAEDYRGDISIVDSGKKLKLHIECKNHQKWSLPNWIRQAEEDCPENRKPIVVFHQHNSSKDYVCISLNDFLSIVEKDKIVEEKE